MSFSSEVKEELSKINNFSKKEFIEAELIGYLLSANTKIEKKRLEFFTENEFNIERIYKILFKLGIEYEPEIKGKTYTAKVENITLRKVEELKKEEEKKSLVRGIFLGSGSVNDPNKKYHLEIILSNLENAKAINITKQ